METTWAGIAKIASFVAGDCTYRRIFGFLYLQAVIEEVTGQSLDQAIAPVVLFAGLYGVVVVIVGLPGLLILRVHAGRWRPTGRAVIGSCGVAFVVVVAVTFILFGNAGLALAGAFAPAFLAGRLILRLLFSHRRRVQTVLTIVWSALIVIGLVLGANRITNLPIPQPATVEPGAAGTLRTTASDLAAFLIELSDLQYLSPELAAQLQTAQVTLADEMSSGLGPGIHHSRQGDALWQWGQHLDFQEERSVRFCREVPQ